MVAAHWFCRGVGLTLLVASGLSLATLTRAPQAPTPLPPVAQTTTPEAASAPTIPPRQPLTLQFVGDIMLDRGVWAKMQANGFDYPFRYLPELAAGADEVIANLEGPITDRGVHAVPNGTLLFKFEPALVPALAASGITRVSLANNHTLNQGLIGLSDTQTHLETAAIKYMGHPKTISEETIQTEARNGWTIAWVGWNVIEVADPAEAALLARIRAIDPEVDLVIVYPHWGGEYRPQNAQQVAWAHALIDAGADVVIGAHPHVVQGIEHYRGKPIIYSLGNYIFDQYWSESTQEGLAVRITLSETSVELRFQPIDLRRSQPKIAADSIAAQIRNRMKAASADELAAVIDAGVWSLPTADVIGPVNLVSQAAFD